MCRADKHNAIRQNNPAEVSGGWRYAYPPYILFVIHNGIQGLSRSHLTRSVIINLIIV